MVKVGRSIVLLALVAFTVSAASCATSGEDLPSPAPAPNPTPTPTPSPTPDAPGIPDGGGDPDAGPGVACTANSQCGEGECCFGPAFGIPGECTVGVIEDNTLGCNPF